jgi:hypothetical protein
MKTHYEAGADRFEQAKHPDEVKTFCGWWVHPVWIVERWASCDRCCIEKAWAERRKNVER